MGEPLRKEPVSERPGYGDPQFNIHRYGTPNRGGGWRWVFLAIVIAVIVWFAIWGHGNPPPAKPVATAPVKPASPAVPETPVVQIPALLKNPADYMGKEIRLRDVLVQSVNGTASIFVGTKDERLLVILKEGAVPDTLQGKPRELPQGGVVTIIGTVDKPGSRRDLEHTAKLHRKEAEEVEKVGVLVNASRVRPQTM